MINNFIISKQKFSDGIYYLIKNKVKNKKTFIKICVIIVQICNGGNYVVKIKGNYEAFNLKNNEKYYVSYKMLIKCEENIWNDYNKFINNDNITNINNNSNEESSLNSNSDKDNLSENEDLFNESINFEYFEDNNNCLKINIIRSKSI